MRDGAAGQPEYAEEQRQKTLRRGRAFAAIFLLGCVYIVFQDHVLGIPWQASAFRFLGITSGFLFFAFSFTVFRKRPQWIIPMHTLQLAMCMTQICGFACVLFYMNPDHLRSTYPHGTTSAIVVCMMATFALASGARPVLWLILAVPTLFTFAFLGLFCSLVPEVWALFANPAILLPVLIAVAYSQHRTQSREFQMRWLAEVREKELEVVAEALRASNQDLESFSRAATHDLNQPLHSIIGYLDLIQSTLPKHYEGQAEVADFMERIISISTGMKRLVRDLLKYSQIGAQEIEATDVDMNAVLSAALQNLHRAIQDAGAMVDHGTMPTVHGNSVLLGAVFQNLIGNAIKYRKTDTSVVVHVSAKKEGDFWQFSVRDNGIGFAPRCVEEVFEPFHRLHSAKAYPGTGVGLASCRKIIAKHGGTVEATSEPGVGSTFFFTLPVRPQPSA